MKAHSPSYKALENPWAVTFKRYFLGHFVDNLDIFIMKTLVQETTILILFLSPVIRTVHLSACFHECFSASVSQYDHVLCSDMRLLLFDKLSTECRGGHELRIHS